MFSVMPSFGYVCQKALESCFSESSDQGTPIGNSSSGIFGSQIGDQLFGPPLETTTRRSRKTLYPKSSSKSNYSFEITKTIIFAYVIFKCLRA